MGGGMRAIKIATIAMGVLIVLGTTVILVTIVKRTMLGPMGSGPPGSAAPGSGPPGSGATGVAGKPFAAVLDEPAGTGIAGIAQVHERLAVLLRGGGTDRVLLIDPLTGAVLGKVSLAR
jgi:hypothetical protein